MNVLGELQRRNVIRMAVAYLVFAWVVMQVLSVVAPIMELPAWAPRMVLLLLAVGFVGVVVFSWIYELTPEGIKRESEVDRSQSITGHTARRLDMVVIALLALSIGLFVYGRYAPRATVAVPEAATSTSSDTGAAAPAGTSSPQSVPDTVSAASEIGTKGKSVAVLPFVNMSSDPEQTYFSDGISEELLNALVKLPGLKVAGRTSSFAFRDKTDDLRAIGKALNVDHILEGSVRKQGKRVRITAQLIQAEDGFHLWSETYDREVTDIFALQDEITQQIVEALEVELGQAPAPTPRVSTDAYALYLRARQQMALRGVASLGEARKLFEQSLALDQSFAPAHAGLARASALEWTYALYSRHDDQAVADVIRRVRTAAEAALALDPRNAEAWSSLGHLATFVEGDSIAAGESHDRALALSPNDAEVVNFAGDHQTWVQDPRAFETESRAVALDPMQAANHVDLAQVLLLRGDYQGALDVDGKAEALGFYERAPDQRALGFIPALIGLRRFDEARAQADRMERDAKRPLAMATVGRIWIAAAEGDAAAVDAQVAQLLEYARTGTASAAVTAIGLIKAGREAEAVTWVDRALGLGDHVLLAEPRLMRLPEGLADPALRAALDKPPLSALYEVRRRNLALQSDANP
jgi:TolB-like protein